MSKSNDLYKAFADFFDTMNIGAPVEEYYKYDTPVETGGINGFWGNLWKNSELTVLRIRDTLDDINGVDSDYAGCYEEKNRIKNK